MTGLMNDLNHPWIARVPLFLPLCASTQAAIDREIHVRPYPKGQSIVLEGHRPSGLCIVVSGLVRIYRMMADGRVHVHHYLRPYAPFNMIAALDGRPNPTSATEMPVRTIARPKKTCEPKKPDRETGFFLMRRLLTRPGARSP